MKQRCSKQGLGNISRKNLASVYLTHAYLEKTGGAFYYFKFLKPKQDIKGTTDLDEFDFDDYEEDFTEEDSEGGEKALEEAEPDETL